MKSAVSQVHIPIITRALYGCHDVNPASWQRCSEGITQDIRYAIPVLISIAARLNSHCLCNLAVSS